MRIGWLSMLVLAACGSDPRGAPDLEPEPDAGVMADAGTVETDAGLVTADPPPPPVSGGTLLVTRDGARAVAADPDRDEVWIASLEGRALEGVIALARGDEPGRLIEDGDGRVHVVLRRAGAVATLSVTERTVIERRRVCPAPRGIDYDAATDALHVACAGGELVTLPAAGGVPTRTLHLDVDLRDVVVSADRLYVSRFRAAELLVLDAAGAIVSRSTPVDATIAGRSGPTDLVPRVAYRLRAAPGGGVVMLHQRATATPLSVEVSGYGGVVCEAGVVHAALTLFDADGTPHAGAALGTIALAVDFALSTDGTLIGLASASEAGSRFGPFAAPVYSASALAATTVVDCFAPLREIGERRASTAVAYSPSGVLLVQHREPAGLDLATGMAEHVTIAFDGARSVADTGHALFHTATAIGMTCASCHPEGGEDGHIWSFGDTGPRRTQTLLGGILETLPFHWAGDQPALVDIMQSTFTERMAGRDVTADEVELLGRWLDAQPALPGLDVDPAAAERGRSLFESAEVGCVSCHAGDALTDNNTVDVGTGGAFQVPSLRGVAHRAPFLHDGCAATLEATIDGSCTPPGTHGDVSAAAPADLADLVAYVATL